MSAFIVTQDTINRIVTTVTLSRFRFIEIELAELGLADHPGVLGRALLEMNVDAVNQRYGDNTNPLVLPYRWSPQPVNKIQGYKSLQCWLYQCSEGNVPQQKLFQVMERFGHLLADEIISALPAYENAEWDIA